LTHRETKSPQHYEEFPAATLKLNGDQMMYRIAFPLLALAVVAGCSATDSTNPLSPNVRTTKVGTGAPAFSESFPRSGVLHLKKQCLEYTGLAGGFCTITASDLEQIEVGSKVVYASAATPTAVDSDLIIDPPGPGNNQAFGHVVLDRVAAVGTITLRGGTGKFTHFNADIVSTRIDRALRLWSLVGTYSFDPQD
jgi:hypothetical protein